MNELDPLIHAPKRLRIMAILATAEQVDVSYLRERLGLSPPDLSKQMKALQDAGYLSSRRSGRGPGSTTWYRMSRTGRKAYENYLTALREVLDGPVTASHPEVTPGEPDESASRDQQRQH